MSKSDRQIVVAEAHEVDGVPFKVGQVVGEMTEDGIVSKHKTMTRGHLQARLRNKKCIVGDPRQFPPDSSEEPDEEAGEGVDYESMTNKDLLALINQRRAANRNVEPASQKKADLISALVADDDKAQAEAEAHKD